MTDPRQLESLLQDAIVLLTESGFPLAADVLRDNLRGIRQAPTAGARLHKIFQLRDVFDGIGSTSDVCFWAPSEGSRGLRFTRTEAQRRSEQRYRGTLASIQEILASARVA